MRFIQMLKRWLAPAGAVHGTEGRIVYRRIGAFGFEYLSDVIAHDYMRRWIIKTPWVLLRLHKIMRGDARDHFHDHPFDFVSLILKGGYVEHRPDTYPRWCFPGDIIRRRATDLHYLDLIDGPTWTFVIASPEYRRWGFRTENGWIDNSEYDAWIAARGVERAQLQVRCKICDAPHRPAYGDAKEGCTQGVDCDGQVSLVNGEWFLLCAYGSSLDGNLYRFRGAPFPSWWGADPVCDRCILAAVERGELEQLRGDFPLGFTIVDGQPVPA